MSGSVRNVLPPGPLLPLVTCCLLSGSPDPSHGGGHLGPGRWHRAVWQEWLPVGVGGRLRAQVPGRCPLPSVPESPCQAQGTAECASAQGVFFQDTGPVSEEEVSLLLADVVPTTSRLRPRTGRTRAIARTRQSERVRATVNRNRISTARRFQVGACGRPRWLCAGSNIEGA